MHDPDTGDAAPMTEAARHSACAGNAVLLSDDTARQQIEGLDAWTIQDRRLRRRPLRFQRFLDAWTLMDDLGGVFERHNHHPDIQWEKKTISLSLVTRKLGFQLTDRDTDLAWAIEEVVRAARDAGRCLPDDAAGADDFAVPPRTGAPVQATDSGDAGGLTHLDGKGKARQVDSGGKAVTRRQATATARIVMAPSTLALILAGDAPKGDVAALARVAGIMAAKHTAALIPLCHPITIDSVDIGVEPTGDNQLLVTARAAATDKTGVEMEALIAAAIAALTIYDMTKTVQTDVTVTDLRLEEKLGGRSGHWRRDRTGDRSGGSAV